MPTVYKPRGRRRGRPNKVLVISKRPPDAVYVDALQRLGLKPNEMVAHGILCTAARQEADPEGWITAARRKVMKRMRLQLRQAIAIMAELRKARVIEYDAKRKQWRVVPIPEGEQ